MESYSPLEPAAKTLTSKIWSNDYLQNVFKSLPPKMLWVLKQADKTQRRQFIENLITLYEDYAVRKDIQVPDDCDFLHLFTFQTPIYLIYFFNDFFLDDDFLTYLFVLLYAPINMFL